MDKVSWKPGTMIYPLPAVMVSCGATREEFNIITVSWTGTICTEPPMCYISLRPERHSYGIISRNREFVINLTTSGIVRAADWCGVRSGRDYDKFAETGLTPLKASKVNAPMIAESPVNIECRVKDIIELGTHHMFISEVVAVNAGKNLVDEQTGEFKLYKADLVSYSHGKYYETGSFIGKFGFSVKKNKSKRRKKQV